MVGEKRFDETISYTLSVFVQSLVNNVCIRDARRCAWWSATRWSDMKVIVNDKDKCLKKFAVNEGEDYDEEEFIGRVGGKYDFIMMVGNGTVYGFEGREITFKPIGDQLNPIGFQW